jgi:hypothetical protein
LFKGIGFVIIGAVLTAFTGIEQRANKLKKRRKEINMVSFFI